MHPTIDRDLRKVPLASAFNLRDFGGYATTDGRRVRRGMLYRSGTMAMLTPDDAAHLRSLGIRAICDFRRESERLAEPTLWHGAETDYYSRNYVETSGILGELLRDERSTPEHMRQAMVDLYRTLHVDHAESYRAMFDRLARGQVPLLINCAVGKDRTGVGAALVLTALGVSRSGILEDYLLTNAHADWDWLLAQAGSSHKRPPSALAGTVEALKNADAIYLDALYAQLDADHGGIDGYLSDVLGIDRAAKGEIRALLLED